MIGAVPPDYAATFYGVIDEDAALATADAEQVAEQAEFEQDSRAELEGVDEVGEDPVHWFTSADAPQPIELERCLYLTDAATCRARMFCLILAKRAASDGSMDGSLPAELWLHCAVMCPITTVQKWVRCRFADWVVASDENWHNVYDGLLNEYQLALRSGADLPRKLREWRLPSPDAHLTELEGILSHDQWEPVYNRNVLWAELAELLVRHPNLRTILNVPEEVMTEAELGIESSYGHDYILHPTWARRPLYEQVVAQPSDVVDKWEHAERIVTRRSFGHLAHWDAHWDADWDDVLLPGFPPSTIGLLCQQPMAWPLFTGGSHNVKQLGCMRHGFPANMNAATAESMGFFRDYNTFSKVHCSLTSLFVVDWDVSAASHQHSGSEELHSTDSVVGTHPTRRQLVGDGFCASLAALERRIVGAGLSPADFRFLICLDDLH